jgi:hypothetical protein
MAGVSNSTSWLTVTSGASGGNGTVAFSAAVIVTTRTGTLTLADLLGEPGSGVVHLHSLTNESVVRREWRHGVDDCHGTSRLFMDRRQQHILADGDEWRDRERQRHGGIQRLGESRYHTS